MRGKVALGFPGRAYLRLVGSSVLFGALLYLVTRGVAMAYRRWGFVNPESAVELPQWLVGRVHPMLVLFGSPVPVAMAVFAAVACFLLWLRQPRGARVEWDEEGISEIDGEGVRTAIRWAEARRSGMTVVVKSKRSGQRSHGGSVEQISDAEGRRITRSMSSWTTPLFLYRRRAECPEMHIPKELPPGDGIVDDGVTRHPRWAVWPMRLGYAVAGLAVYGMLEHESDMDGNGFILLVAGLLIGLRALRPLAELLRLRRTDGAFANAAPVALVGADGRRLVARTVSGEELLFDPAPLHHDDALLHRRRGPAFLDYTEPQQGPEGAYRGGRVTVEAHALELAGNRKARRDLQRAVVAELFVRLLVPLPFLAGGLLLLGLDG